jgi:hypothetical protein
MLRQRPAGNWCITVLSQQNNVPYKSDQENGPKQKNYAGHLEIRVLKDALFPAHPLQCPVILNHHDKQGYSFGRQHEEPDIPRRLRPHYRRTMLKDVAQHIEYRESEAS